jgi:hypothetical protein
MQYEKNKKATNRRAARVIKTERYAEGITEYAGEALSIGKTLVWVPHITGAHPPIIVLSAILRPPIKGSSTQGT